MKMKSKMKASKGGSKTPAKVMGSKGVAAKIPVNHFKNKMTKKTKFPKK